jgi:hypothetical protein
MVGPSFRCSDGCSCPARRDQPAERPDDFTLTTAWQQVVGEVGQQRSRTWATVLIEARSVPVLRGQSGRHCHTDGDVDDGHALATFAECGSRERDELTIPAAAITASLKPD